MQDCKSKNSQNLTASRTYIMMILALFIFTALAEMSVWAKVVDDFNECIEFFYEGTVPEGMDQNTQKICQQYKYGGNFYATLYSTYHRIPVYSAYKFDPKCRSRAGRKSGDWFIEPMLSDISESSMKEENLYERDTIQYRQALNRDYSNTGYDRGHLNPNSFHCHEDDRIATFTLTNSAPMDACFNSVHWKRWEDAVKHILTRLPEDEGTAYLVTGTVSLKHYRIPQQGEFDNPNTRDFNRVTVPTHVWTAVCYKNDNDTDKSFSFGYIGLNQPDSRINIKTVPQLNNELSNLYTASVTIFKDDCFSTNDKSEAIIKQLYKKIQLPISNKLAMSDDILKKFHVAMSQFDDDGQQSSKRPRVTGVTIHKAFDSMKTWFENTERMKYLSGFTCALSQPLPGLIKSLRSTGIQKRDTADYSQELVCNLAPEEVPGCASSCLYDKEARGYYCKEGNIGTTKRMCSPTYSDITVSGAKCNSDHTCGTHGDKDYWCWVGSSRKHCSPPLPMGIAPGGKYCRSNHNCGWYGKRYTWCYTDNNNNWDYCCSIADRYSAQNGKTCKHDHPCNYYGESYLWCYTTDESREKCCLSS